MRRLLRPLAAYHGPLSGLCLVEADTYSAPEGAPPRDLEWPPEPLYPVASMPRLYGPETPGEELELQRVRT